MVAINISTSTDDTEDAVEEILKKEAKSWKIVPTFFSSDDPWFDGKIKNAALQSCTQEFKADEYDWDGEEIFNQNDLLILDSSLIGVEEVE